MLYCKYATCYRKKQIKEEQIQKTFLSLHRPNLSAKAGDRRTYFCVGIFYAHT